MRCKALLENFSAGKALCGSFVYFFCGIGVLYIFYSYNMFIMPKESEEGSVIFGQFSSVQGKKMGLYYIHTPKEKEG